MTTMDLPFSKFRGVDSPPPRSPLLHPFWSILWAALTAWLAAQGLNWCACDIRQVLLWKGESAWVLSVNCLARYSPNVASSAHSLFLLRAGNTKQAFVSIQGQAVRAKTSHIRACVDQPAPTRLLCTILSLHKQPRVCALCLNKRTYAQTSSSDTCCVEICCARRSKPLPSRRPRASADI